MLAVHDSYAVSIAVTSRLTSLGYSGEHFDAKAQQQYLRARFYDPAIGRFNRLDPFAGNMQDPQSLHKYAYVHGDPIGNVDPTGLMIGARGTMAAIAIAVVVGGAIYLGSSSSTFDDTPGIAVLTIRFGWQYQYNGEFDLMTPIERENRKKEQAELMRERAHATARRSVEKLNEYLRSSDHYWQLNGNSRVDFSFSQFPVEMRGAAHPMQAAYDIERDLNNELGVMILTNYEDRMNFTDDADGVAREGTIHFWMWAQNMADEGKPFAFTTLAHELGHLGRYRAPLRMEEPGDPEHHRRPEFLMAKGTTGYKIDREWALAMRSLFREYGE